MTLKFLYANGNLRRKRYKQKLLNTIRHQKSLAYKTATRCILFLANKKAQEVCLFCIFLQILKIEPLIYKASWIPHFSNSDFFWVLIHLCIVAKKRGCIRKILQKWKYLLRRFLLLTIDKCIGNKRKWLKSTARHFKFDLKI